jgi:hypothetical protein
MKTPLPTSYDPPEARQRLLHTASDVPRPQRVQTRYLLQTQQARTRRQVARVLGVSRHTGGRW